MDKKKVGKITSLVMAVLMMGLSIITCPEWTSVGIYDGCDFQNRLMYPFFHANIFHALINVWCLMSVVFLYDLSVWALVVAYLIAVSVPVDFMTDIGIGITYPTVGFSGAVYALLGMLVFKVKRKLYYNLWIIAYILIGFLFPRTNAWLHLHCYIVGILAALLVKPVKWRRRSNVR